MITFECRACGNDTSCIRFVVEGYDIMSCRHCGSMTAAASMDWAEAGRYYDHRYFHGGDYENYELAEPITKRNFGRFVERLINIEDRGSLLELGCAYGYFLDVAKRYWTAHGVDVSSSAVAACAARHPDSVWCVDLLNFRPERAYDWVVGWDVIEHVDKPREYIARCYDLLKPGGHLALTTGDVGSCVARIMGRRWRLLTPPSHLTFFSRRGMRRMLEEAGYATVAISTAGYERSMAFTLFRLLGQRRGRWILRTRSGLGTLLRGCSFYVDLGDIMFVVAERPAGSR